MWSPSMRSSSNRLMGLSTSTDSISWKWRKKRREKRTLLSASWLLSNAWIRLVIRTSFLLFLCHKKAPDDECLGQIVKTCDDCLLFCSSYYIYISQGIGSNVFDIVFGSWRTIGDTVWTELKYWSSNYFHLSCSWQDNDSFFLILRAMPAYRLWRSEYHISWAHSNSFRRTI